jgi:hypothetical protein
MGIDTESPPASIPRHVGAALRGLSLLDAGLATAGLVVILSWAVVAASHLRDRYQVNFVSGVNTALAFCLNQGNLYPSLYDGAHYGGTRYMPLPFVLHAGLARLTGEYLVSGKLLTYTLAVVLGLQLFIILRGLECGRGAALALIGLLLLSRPAFLAGTTIRGDLLPVVLQLAALMIVRRFDGPPALMTAALICALAVLAKMTAGWAALAILLWLVASRRWSSAALFGGVWVGAVLAALAALHWLTDGRMRASFAVCAAVIEWRGALLAPLNLLYRLGKAGVTTGVLVPLLVIGCFEAYSSRRWNLYHVAVVVAMPILVVIFADNGADFNHLLDLLVLSVPVVGGLWAAMPRHLPADGEQAQWTRLTATLVAGWALFAGWTTALEGELREVVYSWRGGPTSYYPARPLAGLIAGEDVVFTEDPWVEVARGKTPTVLDPFVLALVSRKHPELTAPLVRRLRNGEFTKVVLLRRLGTASSRDWHPWYERHLGEPVANAIAERYELAGQAEEFYIYVPRPGP